VAWPPPPERVSRQKDRDEFGNFGSVDAKNNQVDDDPYTIVNAHTMRISRARSATT
jgi:hypothetical protein